MRRILGLAPNVFLLGAVSLFNDFSSEMIYAVMPAFLVGVLGAPALALGVIEGFADALASVLKIFSGWFSDRIGRRKIISVLGYALSTVTRFFLYFVTNFIQVFLLRAIDRVGKGVREAPRDALLTESAGNHDLGRAFGFHRAMDTIGSILGPLTAVVLLPLLFYNYRELFLISFFVGILSLLTFIFVREVKGAPKDIAWNQPPLSFSVRQFPKPFKLFLVSVFIFGLGFMPISLILLSAHTANNQSAAIPLMYLVYSVSFAVFAVPFGKISDRFGEKRILAGGFVFAIGAYLLLARFGTPAGVALGFIVLGLYSAMTDGVGRALTSKLVAPEQLATGQGFLQAAVGFSSLLAGLAGGYIWTYFGPVSAFIYGASLMMVGLLIFIRLNLRVRSV